MRYFVGVIALSLFGLAMARAAGDDPAQILTGKQLSEVEPLLEGLLKINPKLDQVRLSLGMTQSFRAIERFGQGLYRHGFQVSGPLTYLFDFNRLPIPVNPKPEPIDYDGVRGLLKQFLADLTKAEATLAKVSDDQVKLPLHVGRVKFDFTGVGQTASLFEVLKRYGVQPPRDEQKFLICFDRGDASWLRGYCHLLMAGIEFALAQDFHELFNTAGHLLFAKPKTGHEYLSRSGNDGDKFSTNNILDTIAFIHMLRFPLAEADRLKSCHAHLREVCASSREMWRFIQAETDDDHEWIPNAKQTTQLNFRIRQDMIDSWLATINEIDALLQGQRLIPFWRNADGKGVNLKRALLDPRPFDIVLWIQGTAATPYLETGPTTRPEVWDRLQRVFRGEIFWFAAWVN